MRSTSVRFGSTAAVVLLAAVLVWVGACDSGGGTEPAPERGTIQVTVTGDGSALAGVTVRLFESGANTPLTTRLTGSNGVADFTNVEAGSYEAEVVVPDGLVLGAGETARKSVAVAAGGTGTVSFSLESEGGNGDLVEIHLTGSNRFDPSSVTITPGTTVRWINDTGTFHTITPDGHSEWSRVEMTTEGQTFSHTFDGLGTFEYFCEPHESVGMTGTIIVSADE